jgi:hypothetical protein
MERRRHSWFAWSLVASSVVLTAVQCPKGSSSVEEVVDVAVASADDVKALIAKQADAVGSDEEAVAKPWISRLKSAGQAYEGIDPQARAVGCDAVTDWLGALVTPSTADDEPAEVSVAEAVANLNASYGSASLRADLESALKKAEEGEPIFLEVLMIQTGVCEAAG